jgi:hypothetical protein
VKDIVEDADAAVLLLARRLKTEFRLLEKGLWLCSGGCIIPRGPSSRHWAFRVPGVDAGGVYPVADDATDCSLRFGGASFLWDVNMAKQLGTTPAGSAQK